MGRRFLLFDDLQRVPMTQLDADSGKDCSEGSRRTTLLADNSPHLCRINPEFDQGICFPRDYFAGDFVWLINQRTGD